jgi:hypothetical protein
LVICTEKTICPFSSWQRRGRRYPNEVFEPDFPGQMIQLDSVALIDWTLDCAVGRGLAMPFTLTDRLPIIAMLGLDCLSYSFNSYY